MIFKELFNKGIYFETFTNQDGDLHKEKTLDIYSNINAGEILYNKITSISRKIYILGFAEIWCPDCMINVPAIQKLVDINKNFEFKIVSREGNEEAMERFRAEGKIRIPTFIVFNEEFNILGAFIETPNTFKRLIKGGDELQQIIARRKYKKGEYTVDTMEEILKIIG